MKGLWVCRLENVYKVDKDFFGKNIPNITIFFIWSNRLTKSSTTYNALYLVPISPWKWQTEKAKIGLRFDPKYKGFQKFRGLIWIMNISTKRKIVFKTHATCTSERDSDTWIWKSTSIKKVNRGPYAVVDQKTNSSK